MRTNIVGRGERASVCTAILALALALAGCSAASGEVPRVALPLGVGAGLADDANGLMLLATDSKHGRSLRAGVSEDVLRVSISGVPLDPTQYVFQLYLNSGDPQRGEAEWLWPTNGRADYRVEGNTTFQSVQQWDEAMTKWTDPKQAPIDVHAEGTTLELRIPLGAVGVAQWTKPLGIGFVLLNASWGDAAPLPPRGQLAQLDASGRAWNGDLCRWSDTLPAAPPPGDVQPLCTLGDEPTPARRAGEPAFKPTSGIVVPAYMVPQPADLPQDTLSPWQRLANSAQRVAGKSDFFVAVVGANMQAPQTLADFAQYAAVWKPIQEAKGRIFGYVSTCTNCLQSGAIPNYIDPVLVKEQITRWVCGYPELDGIWIDEFYPKYELAHDVRGAPEKLDFPNREENATLDRCFVNPDGTINTSVDVEPSGGYFQQLIAWIRATYPQLQIIGNAGGLLPSNQKRYGELVDLLVSFEQSRAYIDTFPTDPDAAKLWSSDFGMLNAAIAEVDRPQLALIHGTAPEQLSRMLDLAYRRGYTHRYVTDDVLPNPWDSVPDYLSAELP